jgi:glyoxalase family protein
VLLERLHHVTCVCRNAQRTVDFYRDLGFRLVKRTVNFDDPRSYHLYFGDEGGRPGSLITFFEWPGAQPGRLGLGTLDSIALDVPGQTHPRELEDPDGLRLLLLPADWAGLHHVTAYGNPDLYAGLIDDEAPIRFAEPPGRTALIGPGTTHHVAWWAADEEEETVWQERLSSVGLRPTAIQDRKYFRSIYFRMPDGLLIEIATDGPGFAVDEPEDSLGESLVLPDWLEPERGEIEQHLAPLAQ